MGAMVSVHAGTIVARYELDLQLGHYRKKIVLKTRGKMAPLGCTFTTDDKDSGRDKDFTTDDKDSFNEGQQQGHDSKKKRFHGISHSKLDDERWQKAMSDLVVKSKMAGSLDDGSYNDADSSDVEP